MAIKVDDLDGSTLTDDNPYKLRLPFLFRGRDFNATNDLFLSRLLQFHETWLRMPDINVNKPVIACNCPGFLKGQHIVVNDSSILISLS